MFFNTPVDVNVKLAALVVLSTILKTIKPFWLESASVEVNFMIMLFAASSVVTINIVTALGVGCVGALSFKSIKQTIRYAMFVGLSVIVVVSLRRAIFS